MIVLREIRNSQFGFGLRLVIALLQGILKEHNDNLLFYFTLQFKAILNSIELKLKIFEDVLIFGMDR